MKRRILCILMALVLTIGLLPGAALAAGTDAWTKEPVKSDYFYDQLNPRAQAIYTKLLNVFTGNDDAKTGNYYEGTKFIDLIGLTYGDNKTIDKNEVETYKTGNKDLFNDFCAAKDALDLDHSELWWIDSGYLTFRVTQEAGKSKNGGYHVLIGPGRDETYLLGGQELKNAEQMDQDVTAAIDSIVRKAVDELNKNPNASKDDFSEQDKIAYLVGNVHDQITKGIHYRYEIECSKPENAKYIRTLYGLVTHEGVCEAYARTLQVCLTKLGIECVLVHGVQTKGTPEDHMWNAVNIPDNGNHWYVVDATWDDPLVANYDGSRDLTFQNGLDGRETNTYLLVGQSLVGEHWRPSGYVSTGNFEFTYPDIETYAYAGASLEGDFNGIEVKYSAGVSVEDAPAGVFTVTYQGMNAAQARKKGLYFMVKMYDYHPDGTADVMDEWYYADATFILASGSPYFGDHGGGLRIYSATCEYVDIAVTTREPDHRSEWSENPFTSYLSLHPEAGYFHGDESEIVAQTGMLFNMNSGYEAPPYVATQTPAPNGNATAGLEYRFKVTYDDLLYHILPSDENALNGLAAADSYVDNYGQAKVQPVQVRYTTEQEDLHRENAVKSHTVVGELPFDTDRDGIVDATGEYTEFKWIYASDDESEGGLGIECPNSSHHDSDGKCDVNKGCPIVGVEFNFRASDLWIDDVTMYTFSIEGVVGSRSSKFPNNFSIIAMVPGLCPTCYRGQGIDWNLWGQPTLLDSPEDLDLYGMAQAGGTDMETLEELNKEMNRDDLNGRLMLVVEDKSKGAGNREEYEKINDALPKEEKDKIEKANEVFSSVFEINFNRLCPAVNLKPNKGQSLRVQVGYPAGITYESLAGYDLKAYHFTRCSDDEGYRCDHFKEQGHKWGDDIISVNEITVIPTPYGLVIMCDAFSPFEIVAVQKNAATVAAETEHNVVVVSGGNGDVIVNGKKAVGEDGNLKVEDGKDLTFSVKPDNGYAVDTVSFGGEPVTAGSNSEYTLKNVTESDVLSVTFLPEDVKKEEEDTYGSTVVAEVCTHNETQKVKENGKEEKEATCTEDGYAFAVQCAKCGQILSKAHVVPATGHQNVTVNKAAVAATCTTPGSTAELYCNDCHETISKCSTIQTLGHIFTKYAETGTKTCQGVEVRATCDRDGCGFVETAFENRDNVDHKFTVVVESGHIDATCTENSVDTLKCEWCDAITIRENTGTAKGHKWGADGYCTVCDAFRCGEGHTWEKVAAVPATCTADGLTEGERCAVCGAIRTPQDVVPAHHTWDSDGECTVCGQRRCEGKHPDVKPLPTVEATCTRDGLSGGKRCAVCGAITEEPTVVDRIPHEWDTSNITWHWSEAKPVSATAEIRCTKGNHTEIFTAETTCTEEITAPTCTKDGKGVYTATVTVDGREFIDKDGDRTLPISALGHDWDKENPVESTEATCTRHATAKYECKRCETIELIAHTEQELPPHKPVADHTLSVAATCTGAGKTVGVCTVCGEKVDMETIPALGHNYVNGRCTRCGAAEPAGPAQPGPSNPTQPEPEKPAKHPVVRTYTAFKDVPAGSWYEEDLKFAYERGLIGGTGSNTFSPDDNIRRVEWMTLLARFDFVEEAQSENWDTASMAWAVEKGISDGSDPNGSITREQLVTMLWRYFGKPEAEETLSTYTDAGSVSGYAVDAFRWAVSEGVINGVTRTELDPQGTATRAQAAVIFARFVKLADA